MRRLVIALALCLGACRTTYVPQEYPLRDGLIEPIALAGSASVRNDQPSSSPVLVYSEMGSTMSAGLDAVTETMVQQATRELAKNTGSTQPGEAKMIGLKVLSLVSHAEFYFWRSAMTFETRLGDAEPFSLTVSHGSGVLIQDLNGCIAEGVIVLFKDPQVRAYLAR